MGTGFRTRSCTNDRNKRLQRTMTSVWNKYAPTAARKHGKVGREVRPQSITIDMHAHVAVPRAGEFAGKHVDPATVPLSYYSSPATKAVNTKQDADMPGRIVGYDQRLKDMDA